MEYSPSPAEISPRPWLDRLQAAIEVILISGLVSGLIAAIPLSFLHIKDTGLLVLPVTVAQLQPGQPKNMQGNFVFQGAYVYNLTLKGGFTLKGKVTHYDSNDAFQKSGQYFYGGQSDITRSLYIGNVILVILNLPFIPVWVAVLKIPYSILMTLILAFCVVGVYSLSNSVFDIGVMLAFGVVGYAFKKLDIPTAPLVLTMILGPMMERGLRQSLEMSRGHFSILFTRPISAALLGIAALVIVTAAFRAVSAVRGADSQV